MKEADWELGRKQTARTNTIQQQKTYSFICFLPQLPPLLLYLVLVISIFPLFISPSRSLFSTGTFWVQCPLILFWARCPLFSRFPKSSLLPPALLPLFHNVLMSNSFSPFLPTSLFLSFAWSILLTFVSLPLYFLLYLFSHIIFPLPPPLPASRPPAAGGRFRGPGGDDLTVDGAQQQHEPDGSKHLGGRYPMRLRDGHVQDCCCHCGRERSKRSWQHYKQRSWMSRLLFKLTPNSALWGPKIQLDPNIVHLNEFVVWTAVPHFSLIWISNSLTPTCASTILLWWRKSNI